jgi:hypothetical protein
VWSTPVTIGQQPPSPIEFVQFGVLGAVIFALIMGWLWAKPAVDRLLADKDRLIAERAECAKQTEALAAKVEGKGQYNIAKLLRASADAISRRAAYGIDLPNDRDALVEELAGFFGCGCHRHVGVAHARPELRGQHRLRAGWDRAQVGFWSLGCRHRQRLAWRATRLAARRTEFQPRAFPTGSTGPATPR